MSKYDPLADWLNKQNMSVITLTFTEIEEILGFPLCKSAHTYSVWWGETHVQAVAWKSAGYKVSNCMTAPQDKYVQFVKKDNKAVSYKYPRESKKNTYAIKSLMNINIAPKILHGYEFKYIDTIEPMCDSNGTIIEYMPQKQSMNINNLSLHQHGKGPFCKFKFDGTYDSGVYLWVIDDEIIYIGETINLNQRFSANGYGQIYSQNCYYGGQITNCKMNHVVLEKYKKGEKIKIYFYKTDNHKQVEEELLRNIVTKYNSKIINY